MIAFNLDDSAVRLGGRRGISFPAGAGAAPWTPASIANLSLFHFYKAGENCCFASNGGAASGVGDAVGYAAPLYGTSISASEATNKPILRADGLEFAASGTDVLTTSADITLAGDFTIYLVYESVVASAFFPVLSGSSAGDIAGAGNGFSAFFDSGFSVASSIAAGLPDGSPTLLRLTRTGTTVAMSGGSSGGTEVTAAPLDTALSLVLSRIGLSSDAVGPLGNDDSANRITLVSISTSYIAPNSAADIANRAGLAALTGAFNW